MENDNEIYLADWLAGKISNEQLKLLVSEDDFLAYQKLKNALEEVNSAFTGTSSAGRQDLSRLRAFL